jgi:omega-6 fatty acid desaturase (delta-12 desaturase)
VTITNDISLDTVTGADSDLHRAELEQYARSDFKRSLLALATSVLPFLALWALMFAAYATQPYWVVLLLAVPAAGFMVRTYILFHDCVHGSFLESRAANAWLGRVLGLLAFTPYARWRYEHLVHHATAGDLDRRGVGDVPMSTVREFDALSPRGKLGYRLYRNQFVMYLLGPIYSTFIMQRLQTPSARKRLRRSVMVTNLAALVLVAALVLAFGWLAVLLVELPIVVFAGGAGIWLFYVQHQYPGSYWVHTDDWSYTDAALYGSSYLALPRVLQFFTGNIGFHHVHHLNPKIPNYNLQRAHEEQPFLQAVPALSLVDGLRATRLKLYDEDTGRIVTWNELRARPASA